MRTLPQEWGRDSRKALFRLSERVNVKQNVADEWRVSLHRAALAVLAPEERDDRPFFLTALLPCRSGYLRPQLRCFLGSPASLRFFESNPPMFMILPC